MTIWENRELSADGLSKIPFDTPLSAEDEALLDRIGDDVFDTSKLPPYVPPESTADERGVKLCTRSIDGQLCKRPLVDGKCPAHDVDFGPLPI